MTHACWENACMRGKKKFGNFGKVPRIKEGKKELGNFGRLDGIQEGFHVKKLTIGQKF